MKKIAIGLIIFFCVISLIFSYSVNFDYTYTGEEYGVDFETPTKLNASKIKGSFASIYNICDTVVSFVGDTLKSVIETFSNDLSTDDAEFDNFYNSIRARSLEYISENYNFFMRFYHKSRLNGVTDVIKGYQKFIWFEMPVFLNSNDDIMGFINEFGWTYDETLRVHNFMVEHNISHNFGGILYGE